MKKKAKKISLLACLSLTLSGCLSSLEEETTTEELAPGEVTVHTTKSQLSPDFYRSAIVDGRYNLGIATSSYATPSSPANQYAFEEGLLRISKEIFPTSQYYIHEGTIIDEQTMTNWLARESEDNPEGLNPKLQVNEEETNNEQEQEQEESVDPADSPEGQEEQEEQDVIEATRQVRVDNASTPIYLAQLMEKNIMIETNDGYELAGILIGLGMNNVYQYTDSEGVVYEQEISVGEMRERGKSMANIIAGRLRNTPELRSLPIVFGIYQMAPSDSTAGGTYLLDGISREGNYVTDWQEHNEYRVSLPQIGMQQGQNPYGFFDDFSDQINNFFPNLNGISGEALFIDEGIASLRIEIVSQFYQITEITALTQHVVDVAEKTLPTSIDVEIVITSASGIQAYVGKTSAMNNYQSHVFNK